MQPSCKIFSVESPNMNNSHDEKTWLIVLATSSWKLVGKKKEIIWGDRWKHLTKMNWRAFLTKGMLIKLVLLSW